ncbi:MAG TPA: YunC family protein [Gemmataceae bacterium]|nr:YunC family protein [Gemmataceae bacterium]
MSDALPRTISRPIQFQNGCAIGISNRWQQGQYCTILTEAGLVGCGIYDVKTAAEFGQAVAIARGTPQKPLVNPEDLFDAKIVDATPKAKELGINVGMTGREAVELLLAASRR